MFNGTISYLTPAETSFLNASVLNRPLAQLANNTFYLKQQLDAITGAESLLVRQPCSTAVLVGTPVGWNPSLKVFEPAQAGFKTCLGICVSKPSSTSANIRMVGFDRVDLTSSTGSASPPAGLYYLSQTTAGELSINRPAAGIQQPVLYADGQGGVYLLFGEYLPLAGPQGIQGIPGTTGATGATGAKGDAGPAALPGFVSGRWYTGPINYSPVGANYSFPANKLVAVPFAAPGGASLTELAIKVLAAGNPGDEARLGIYADNGQYPAALLTAANGVLNGASAGPKVVSINTTAIAAGRLVWLVLLLNSNSVGIQSLTRDNAWAFKGWADGLHDPVLGYMVDQTYGALPASFPSNADELTAVVPTIFAKAA